MAFTIKAVEKSASKGFESQAAGNSSSFVGSLLVLFSPRSLLSSSMHRMQDEEKEKRGIGENLLTIRDNVT